MTEVINKIKNYYVNSNINKNIMGTFKHKYDFNKRCTESSKILNKYPDRVPIICERMSKQIVKLDKTKFLCPRDLNMGNFMYIIRKRMKLSSEKSIYLFVGKSVLAPSSKNIDSIYEKYKDKDGFLYIGYDSESTFG